jgi:hypothetical protein
MCVAGIWIPCKKLQKGLAISHRFILPGALLAFLFLVLGVITPFMVSYVKRKDVDTHHYWCTMTSWMFLAFASEMGVRYLDDWVETLDQDEENEFAAILEGLQVLPRHLWQRPQFAMLGQQYRGVGEIRFKVARKQFRVFGFFGPRPMQFTLLHACGKQRSNLRHDMTLAARRKGMLERGQGTVYEFTIKRRPDRQTSR